MNKLTRIYQKIKMPIFIWIISSIFCSVIKSYQPYNDTNNCDKVYPVGYIFYTNLFCEIEKENKNE